MEEQRLPIRVYGDFIRELGKAVERARSFDFEDQVLDGLDQAIEACSTLHEGYRELELTVPQCEQLAGVIELFMELRVDRREPLYERLGTFRQRLLALASSPYIRKAD